MSLNTGNPVTSTKPNASALELWQQVFSNLAKQPNAAMLNSAYDPTEDRRRYRDALRAAGWLKKEIEARIELEKVVFADAPATSPGVNPHAEVLLERLRSDIESAMERLRLDSQTRVALGVEPRLGPYAATTNVPMTNESVVMVGAHLFRFCGLIARAYVRTLNINPYFWEAGDYSERLGRRFVFKEPKILIYWRDIYLS